MILFRFMYLPQITTLTFSSSSVYTIPLWSRGGTEDLQLGEIHVLRIDHQFLEERESDFSLFEILSM